MDFKKIRLIMIFVFSLSFLCGCGKEEKINVGGQQNNSAVIDVVEDGFDEEGTGVLNCMTEAYAGENVDVDLSYVVTYKNGNILELHSAAKITSSDQKSLDEYENAYQKIADNYHGLKYYDISLIRDSNTVTYDTVINYDKIDVDELLAIEGAEDNVIVNGKAKLSLWLDLASKMGTTCGAA